MSEIWILNGIVLIINLILISGKGGWIIAALLPCQHKVLERIDIAKFSKRVGYMMLFVNIGIIVLELYVTYRVMPAKNMKALESEMIAVGIAFIIYIIMLIIISIIKVRKNKSM